MSLGCLPGARAAIRAGLKILIVISADAAEAEEWRVHSAGDVKVAQTAAEVDMMLADSSTGILVAVCPRDVLDDPARRNSAEKLGFVTCDPCFGVSPRYLAYWITRKTFEEAIALYFKGRDKKLDKLLATLQDLLILSSGKSEYEHRVLLHLTTDYLGPDFSPSTSALQARIHEDKRAITNETLVLEELCIQAVYYDARGAGALVSHPVARYHQYTSVKHVHLHLTLTVSPGFQAWQQGQAAFELVQLIDNSHGCIKFDEVVQIRGFTVVIFSKPIRLPAYFAPSFTVLTPRATTPLATNPPATRVPNTNNHNPQILPHRSGVFTPLLRAFALPALAAVIHILSQCLHASVTTK